MSSLTAGSTVCETVSCWTVGKSGMYILITLEMLVKSLAITLISQDRWRSGKCRRRRYVYLMAELYINHVLFNTLASLRRPWSAST